MPADVRVQQWLALLLLASMLVTALHDVSQAWDVGYYHLPFAGRLAGLLPESEYVFSSANSARYRGFPLLAELLQGLCWRVTGRPETTNLVAFASLPLVAWFASASPRRSVAPHRALTACDPPRPYARDLLVRRPSGKRRCEHSRAVDHRSVCLGASGRRSLDAPRSGSGGRCCQRETDAASARPGLARHLGRSDRADLRSRVRGGDASPSRCRTPRSSSRSPSRTSPSTRTRTSH